MEWDLNSKTEMDRSKERQEVGMGMRDKDTLHRTENLKHTFPGMKLRSVVPNFYIHVSVSDLYFSMIGSRTIEL
jgi:hypothetical protein